MKKCERCGNKHDGSFGSGRFCSSKCSHTRTISEEHKKSISKKLKGHSNNKGQVPWNKGKKGLRGRYWCPNKIDAREVLAGKHPNMSSTTLRNKLLAEGIIEDKCEVCGWSKKREGYRFSTCHLHHKNGNSKDHRLENLQLLCPNCHSLTPTFCKRKSSVGKAPRRTFDYRGKEVRSN